MSTILTKRWETYPILSAKEAEALDGFCPALSQVLHNRGIKTREEAERFLAPELSDLASPFLLKGMAEAIARLREALAGKQSIAIYGDYDADGVCSSTILYQAIKQIHERVIIYIPDRGEEGYGLNSGAISRLAERDVELIITVDCGVSNVEEVKLASELGVDVIITDHHHVPDVLPQAVAIVNPHQADCTYPFKDLAGAGVTYRFIQALEQTLDFRLSIDPLDLVALATIADIVPLQGENRILVRHGLELINQALRPGLAALITSSGYQPGQIETYHVGFYLAPRLNAAGRLSDAREAVKLLLAGDAARARSYADKLTDLNSDRQKLTQEILEQAEMQIAEQAERRVLVAGGKDWPTGIVGLVAGKICEKEYRPVLIMEQGQETSRGSARSIPGFDVTEALTRCQDLLLQFGGHAMAAGFELRTEDIPEFSSRMEGIAREELSQDDLLPLIKADAEIDLAEVDLELFELLEKLGPFGYANPRPLFISRAVKLLEKRLVGSARDHLRLTVGSGSSRMVGIGFGLGKLAPTLQSAASVDLLYSIDENIWEGVRSLQLKLKDLRSATEKV